MKIRGCVWQNAVGASGEIGAIAHRLCRLIWKILRQGITYEERGPAVTKQRAQAAEEVSRSSWSTGRVTANP